MKILLIGRKVLVSAWMGIIFTFATQAYADIADVEKAILLKDYIGAQKLAENVIAEHPKNSVEQKAQYYIGLSQLEQAKYAEALDSFGKISSGRMDPQFRNRVYLGKFDAYYLLEQYEKAEETLLQYMKESKPEALSLVYFKLAKANLKMAHWSKATEYLEKIIRSFPNSLEVRMAKQSLEEKHYFAVQVGAFQGRQLAESLVDELKQKQEYAYIVETLDPQNKKFYRVRVGQLTMLRDAKNLKLRIAKLGYPAQIYP